MTAVFTILLLLLAITLCVFAHLYFEAKDELNKTKQSLSELEQRNDTLAQNFSKFKERTARIEQEFKGALVVLTDKAPKKGTRDIDNVLALSDLLKRYVKRDGDKVTITVVKD